MREESSGLHADGSHVENRLAAHPLAFYLFNLRLGLATDYTRYFEYPKALNMLQIPASSQLTLLDVGSGRLGQFPLFMASRFHNLSIWSTDPREDFSFQLRYVNRLGLTPALKSGRLRFEPLNILSSTIPNETFDRITCISTVEHIPGTGDSAAMANMARLLKPGGLLVISFPFNWYKNGELYLSTPVYRQEDPSDDYLPITRHFFERIYDPISVQNRLIRPSGLSQEQVVYFGEPGFSMGRFIHRGYRKLGIVPSLVLRSRLLQLFMPVISPLFLKELQPRAFDAEDWSGVGVVMSLRKR